MKLKLLLSGLLLCVFSVSAQDIITMTDGSTIKAKVEEITDSAIKYRKHSNLTGPVYTLKLDAVSKIVYQNGATDLFNASTEAPAETPAATVENEQPAPTQPNTQLNEAELLTIAEMTDLGATSKQEVAAIKYKKKAKTYKLVGWIGGSAIVAAGLLIPIIIDEVADYGYYFACIGLPMTAAGAAWCVAWNVAANKQMKKARMAEAYSVPVIEGEMLRIGNNPLIGSINVMGDNFTRSRSLGLGLTYKF